MDDTSWKRRINRLGEFSLVRDTKLDQPVPAHRGDTIEVHPVRFPNRSISCTLKKK